MTSKQHSSRPKKNSSKPLLGVLLALVLVGIVAFGFLNKKTTSKNKTITPSTKATTSKVSAVNKVLYGGVTQLPPSQIKVLVANGSYVSHAASNVTSLLKHYKYQTLTPTNGVHTSSTEVFFMSGYDFEAAKLGKLLGLPPSAVMPFYTAPATTPPVNSPQGADIVVLVGPGLAHSSIG